jgi:hypothetical protein
LSKFVLEKSIAAIVAQRLADLGPVHTLFTFELRANATFIPHFTDAASLEEILEVRTSWPFDPEHTQILGADVRVTWQFVGIVLTAVDTCWSFQPARCWFAEKQI